MFTGITEETTTVVSNADGVLRVETPEVFSAPHLGASISLNGVCMTVSSVGKSWLGFDVSPETRNTTTLGHLAAGARANLERPLRFGDLLGGHMLLGHVDGAGVVVATAPELRVRISAPLILHCVEKGSVALDGVRLTIFNRHHSFHGRARHARTSRARRSNECRSGHRRETNRAPSCSVSRPPR